ncbi:type II toxin-antitoxin system HicB family antitoxin [Halovivax limisalsi]|uniref:type II toxin-antitoxin system HicB family antitoxin n=1 Tax=Halovivax limisalsi TaxID=1453760 RepID=UPI001FFDADD8|nr:type II toxin-antitoxin system HicB family antitoxin [Halovivax limisalsi]
MGVQSRPNGDETITVTHSDDWFVAKDESTGVASQGKTKAEALENLADALQLHTRPVPDEVEGEPDPSSAPWL